MLKLLVILGFVLFLSARFLPRLGQMLGLRARKPFRQARWMWSWFAGSEADSIAAEREYGRECAREFVKEFPASASPEKQEAAASVGSRLANAVNDPRREFRFTVVRSDAANAFALPGGFVFVTEPLLDLCDCDRDDVAFLLGHEMAHVLRGHAKDQLTAGTLLHAIAGRVPGAGVILREALSKGYSRELELEADREAVRLAQAAGFNAAAGVRVLQRLAQRRPGGQGLEDYFSTHPSLDDRIRELKAVVDSRSTVA